MLLKTCVAEQNHALAWLAKELAIAAGTEMCLQESRAVPAQGSDSSASLLAKEAVDITAATAELQKYNAAFRAEVSFF